MADVIVYGADWCPDCRRSKKLLDRLSVPYTYVDVDEDPVALETMKSLNGGRQSIPVVVFPDGHHLTEPSDPALRTDLEAAGLIPADPDQQTVGRQMCEGHSKPMPAC